MDEGTRFDVWVIKTARITPKRYPNVESGAHNAAKWTVDDGLWVYDGHQ